MVGSPLRSITSLLMGSWLVYSTRHESYPEWTVSPIRQTLVIPKIKLQPLDHCDHLVKVVIVMTCRPFTWVRLSVATFL